jgi:hypothetical protein
MAITNYPNGVSSFGMPLIGTTTGSVWFVDNSTGSNGNSGTDADHPFADIDYAIGRCTASKADIIFVMPDHTEDIAAAGGIALDVEGVSIIGLGSGSNRPTITYSATDSTMTITAANCTISNIVFEAAIADVVTGISLSAAADYTTFNNIESYEGSAAGTFNFVDFITLATGCNNLTWKDCKFIGNDTNNDAFITGVAHDGFYIENCIFHSNVAQAAAHGLVVASGNVTNMRIKNCDFRSNIDGALFIDFDGAACGGTISYCNFSSIDTAGAVTNCIDATGAHAFECYVAGEADSFGLVGGGTVYNNA